MRLPHGLQSEVVVPPAVGELNRVALLGGSAVRAGALIKLSRFEGQYRR